MSLFENISFLNEGIFDKIKYRKQEYISEDEFKQIMNKFKILAKGLDSYRNKVNKFRWLSDANPDFVLGDDYYNIFKKDFNKKKSINLYYSIIFKENDYDNKDFNINQCVFFCEDIFELFCKKYEFEIDKKAEGVNAYKTAKGKNKYEGFKVGFYYDTEASICIEYIKK